MHNNLIRDFLLSYFALLHIVCGQTFSVQNVKEISIPKKVIERPQFSLDNNWLSLETYSDDGMVVYFVDLRESSQAIPLRKTPNSKNPIYAHQVRWSTTRDDVCYFIGKDQIGQFHFYEVNMSYLASNRAYLDDLCEKIFGRHNVDISTYAVNRNNKFSDYFLFALPEETRRDSRIGIYTSSLQKYPESYQGLLNHFTINSLNQLACVKSSDNDKNPKIVLFEDDLDQKTEVMANKSVTRVAEIEPKFSIYSPGDYLTFLATEDDDSESRDWYLWAIKDPFNPNSNPRKIDGPIVIRGEDISLSDLNYAWYPDRDFLFYILESKDGSNPVYYYNINSGHRQKLVTNTERNMYINFSRRGNKMVFGAQGKSKELDFYIRKAYVGDLVVQ